MKVCFHCGQLTDSTRGFFAHIGGVGDNEFVPVCATCRAKDPEAWLGSPLDGQHDKMAEGKER